MSKTLHTGENCRFITEADVIPHARRLPLTRGRQTVTFENAPRITGRYSVVGKKEGKGPLGKYFHKIVDDDKMHEKTFEKAEIDMLTAAIDGAAEDCGLPIENIDLLIAGDLLNQITSSSYVAREMNIPYMGVYSACSTMSESLAVGAAMITSCAPQLVTSLPPNVNSAIRSNTVAKDLRMRNGQSRQQAQA